MKILITGALGHIGSRLIHTIKPGQFSEIRLIDNLSTQRFPSLFNLPKGIKFNFIKDDICTTELDKLFKGIDVVIHLAAVTDAASSFKIKKIVDRVNFYGTTRVAKACLKNKSRLIFPSTTSVYGVQKGLVDENCPKKFLKPQSPYAVSKLKAEEFLMNFGREKKLKFTICRLGTIFGISIGMRFHTAVNKFIWQSVLGEPISVWQTALNQKRPYLYLSDCVAAFFHIIKNNLFNNQIYNLVTVNSTVNDIIRFIKEDIPDLRIRLVKSRIMNQLSYEVSNKKIVKTGFSFEGNINKGVKETIQLLSGMKQ